MRRVLTPEYSAQRNRSANSGLGAGLTYNCDDRGTMYSEGPSLEPNIYERRRPALVELHRSWT